MHAHFFCMRLLSEWSFLNVAQEKEWGNTDTPPIALRHFSGEPTAMYEMSLRGIVNSLDEFCLPCLVKAL